MHDMGTETLLRPPHLVHCGHVKFLLTGHEIQAQNRYHTDLSEEKGACTSLLWSLQALERAAAVFTCVFIRLIHSAKQHATASRVVSTDLSRSTYCLTTRVRTHSTSTQIDGNALRAHTQLPAHGMHDMSTERRLSVSSHDLCALHAPNSAATARLQTLSQERMTKLFVLDGGLAQCPWCERTC